jgi:hypothetical protein
MHDFQSSLERARSLAPRVEVSWTRSAPIFRDLAVWMAALISVGVALYTLTGVGSSALNEYLNMLKYGGHV